MAIEVLSSVGAPVWDDFVSSNPRANIFHTRDFFDCFQGFEKYVPHAFFLVEDGRPLALIAALQTRVLGNRLEPFASRSVVYGGVLTSNTVDAHFLERHVGSLFRAFDDTLARRTLLSEIRNMDDATDLVLPAAEEGHHFEPHLNYVFDLEGGEDPLWRRLSQALRKSIRRAPKKGLEVVEATGADELGPFATLVEETYAKVHVPVFELAVFENAWRVLSPKGRIRVTLARHDGRTVASRAALVYNGRVFDWFAGSNAEGYRLNANTVLAWDMISWGCRNGQRCFDFGGAGDPRTPYSVREFKRRFHGRAVNYGRFTKVYSRPRYAIGSGAYRILRRVFF